MTTKDTSLYGIPRRKRSPTRTLANPNTLSFSSALSHLITTSASTSNTPGHVTSTGARQDLPAPKKENIFISHKVSKNPKKRAAAEALATENAKNDAARVDNENWRRAKRRMEEKARLYAAMKRGDVEDEEGLVDFYRKWAENEEDGRESSEEEDDGDSDEETVTYTDEFGRQRTGTRAAAAREESRRKRAERLAAEGDKFSARPAMPASGIIYGDRIQTEAFNPDEPIAAQMAELATKRDREATPPPETHYDANGEIRTKGTGFFKFSGDEEERRKQMENLEAERRETENARAERERKLEERKKAIEERRKKIGQQRGRLQADRFLESLGQEMFQNKKNDDERGEEGRDSHQA